MSQAAALAFRAKVIATPELPEKMRQGIEAGKDLPEAVRLGRESGHEFTPDEAEWALRRAAPTVPDRADTRGPVVLVCFASH